MLVLVIAGSEACRRPFVYLSSWPPSCGRCAAALVGWLAEGERSSDPTRSDPSSQSSVGGATMVISRCAVALWSLALVETTMQAFSSGLLVPVVVDGNQVDFELAEPIESVEAIAAEAQRWCFRNGIEQEPGIGECVEALVERTIELLDQQQQVQVMPDGDSAAAQEAKPLFVVDVQLVWGEGENDRQVRVPVFHLERIASGRGFHLL